MEAKATLQKTPFNPAASAQQVWHPDTVNIRGARRLAILITLELLTAHFRQTGIDAAS